MEQRDNTKASSRIPEEIRNRMRREIQATQGREVLFVCQVGDDVCISDFVVAARGGTSMVPAPMPHMNRGDVIIHNHPSNTLYPSNADLSVASELAQRGIGSWIVDSALEGLYVITEPYREPEPTLLNEQSLAGILEPEGALEREAGQDYEPRESQVALLSMICRGFNEDRIVVGEAGTGVGKSFAYLIPAMAWAQQNNQRVVISTATINLQHQLIEKDIPTVERLLGTKVKTVLAKGRNNYLCLNRLEEVQEEDSLFREEDDELNRVVEWARVTATGMRTDLGFYVPDALWSRINSDPDSCSGARCRNRDHCFLLKARREAAQAQIIITNHHLFFADASMRSGGMGFESTVILPPFSRVIFDEAHTIEGSATSYFSRTLSRFTLHKYLTMLLRRKQGRSFGLIQALRSFLGLEVNQAEALIEGVREALGSTEAAILQFLGEQSSLRLHPALAQGEGRFSQEYRDLSQGIFGPLRGLQKAILELADHVVQELKQLSEEDLELPQVHDVKIILRRLEDAAAVCQDFQQYEQEPDRVFWIDKNRVPTTGERFIRLTITPLDIRTMMRETVFEPYPTVIMTSATLSIKGSFQYFDNQVGLQGLEPLQAVFPSPFDYRQQVMLGIPADAPPPQSPAYNPFLVNLIREAVLISEGKALILFTSYAMLNEVFAAVKPALDEAGIPVFRQGDDDKTRLLRTFRDDVSSVLFATDSFWEGVDTPGSSLELLILCRLPFRVPTDPVVIARAEAIEARGGNAFIELSIPEAVMKFKQGFGRLMRRASDRGIVLVTDPRIIQKSYGSMFTGSLPETRRSIKETRLLLKDIESFLYS